MFHGHGSGITAGLFLLGRGVLDRHSRSQARTEFVCDILRLHNIIIARRVHSRLLLSILRHWNVSESYLAVGKEDDLVGSAARLRVSTTVGPLQDSLGRGVTVTALFSMRRLMSSPSLASHIL